MSDTPTIDTAPDAAPAEGANEALPSPVDLVTSTLSIFMDNILPMLMLGLGQLVVGLIAAVVLIPFFLGCVVALSVGLGATGGVIDVLLDGQGQLGAGAGVLSLLVSYIVGIGGLLIVATIITSPFVGSLMRAMDAHLAGEAEATFGGVFETATQQPLKDIASNTLLMVLVVLGLPFCYVGALIPAFFLMWMTLACEVDGLTLSDAIRRSIRAIRERPAWCLGVYALGIVFGMLASYVPILGPVAAILFTLRAYRAIFPREVAA